MVKLLVWLGLTGVSKTVYDVRHCVPGGGLCDVDWRV